MTRFGKVHRSVSSFDHVRGPRIGQWQFDNCSHCKFATQSNVGTGRPCCTYPGKIDSVGGICQQRRELEEQ